MCILLMSTCNLAKSMLWQCSKIMKFSFKALPLEATMMGAWP